jgi:hypothetical protein
MTRTLLTLLSSRCCCCQVAAFNIGGLGKSSALVDVKLPKRRPGIFPPSVTSAPSPASGATGTGRVVPPPPAPLAAASAGGAAAAVL